MKRNDTGDDRHASEGEKREALRLACFADFQLIHVLENVSTFNMKGLLFTEQVFSVSLFNTIPFFFKMKIITILFITDREYILRHRKPCDHCCGCAMVCVSGVLWWVLGRAWSKIWNITSKQTEHTPQ